MRLLLDMGVSPRTADFLRQSGYDAVHLWEERLERLSDAEIVTKAAIVVVEPARVRVRALPILR